VSRGRSGEDAAAEAHLGAEPRRKADPFTEKASVDIPWQSCPFFLAQALWYLSTEARPTCIHNVIELYRYCGGKIAIYISSAPFALHLRINSQHITEIVAASLLHYPFGVLSIPFIPKIMCYLP
jgi:hypothetical protein